MNNAKTAGSTQPRVQAAASTTAPGGNDAATEGLLTVLEACNYLRLSRSEVWRLMDRGVLAYCRFGRARRIPVSQLRRFVSDNLVHSLT